MAKKLEGLDLTTELARIPGWRLNGNSIEHAFVFPDFSRAFGFMTRVAMQAETHDHHPDWQNVWNRVEIALTTHDSGGVTALDIEMAQAISRIATECGAK